MIRTFRQHRIREEQELGGFWDVTVLSGEPMPEETHYKMGIPGCVESIPALRRFQGKCAYERNVTLEEDGDYLLTCYGVSFLAEVYWDGELIGSHYNAFTRFDLLIHNVRAGVHTLKINVDNLWNPEISALHVPNDYNAYNGITRPIVLAKVPQSYIDWFQLAPKKGETGWSVDYRLCIRGRAEKEVRCTVTLVGQTVSQEIPAFEETCIVCGTILCPDVACWEPISPVLYEARAVLSRDGQQMDDLTERIGFRTVRVEGNEILLNDKPIFLKGFCRHEDFGNRGCALSVESMMEDLQLMREMGANSVRTSHYPNDVRFLDLCDELGMLVWEENHARGLSEEQMRHPNFDAQCAECIDKMITYDYNHPSIYIWGILNECASETEYGRSCYEKQFAQIRSLDQNRPVTFASCKNFADLCFDLVDVVSMNVYPGWYHNTPPKKWVDDLKDWIATTGGAGKPFLLSEFGAGAIYGYHDYGRCKWSEERQADILDAQLTDFLASGYVNGTYIWQFADCNVSEEIMRQRPKCENNKGVVDLYRRPKMAFDVVRKHYKKK